jgi:hypothetical protein
MAGKEDKDRQARHHDRGVTTVVTNEHVRADAMSEGRIRRAGEVHDTRCVHIPSRHAGEGAGGQGCAQRDIKL